MGVKRATTTQESTYPPGSWTPIRRGPIYCSPACGCSCRFSDFKRAHEEGAALATSLGQGWTFSVWENGGWHRNAISPCTRLKIHGGPGRYTAFLGEFGSMGGLWVATDADPREAVRQVVVAGRRELAKLGAAFTDLSYFEGGEPPAQALGKVR